MLGSGRSVGHKRNREEICSASGSLCYGATRDGCESFNSKLVSFDTPCFKDLDSEDFLLSFEKIRTDVTECRNLWNNKFKSPEKMMLLPHDIVTRLDSMENTISSVISECKKDYAQFINKHLTLGVSEDLRQSPEKTSRAVSDGKECAIFSSKPVSSDTPFFKNLDVEDLVQSFEKVCTDAAECRNLWNNKFKSPGKMMLLSHDFQKRLDSIENISSVIEECKKEYKQFINKPLTLDFPCVFNLGVSEDLRQSLKKTRRAHKKTRKAVADGKKCAKFSSKPLSLDFPCSKNLEVQVHFQKKENLEVLEDIRRSLEKVRTAAEECRNLWKSSGEIVPLSGFGNLLESVENISTAKAKFEGAISFISKHLAVDFPCISNSGVSGDLVERTGSGKFISKPISFNFPCFQIDLPCFENVEVSENLRQSLEKISSAVVECTNLWNNKITSSGNLVPLSEFQKLLESHGLLWHKCIVLKNGVTANQLRSRINQRPYDLSDFLPDLTSESLWEKASEDFFRACHICFELERNFNGQQVGQLASFLDYLIMIQEDQRSVAYSFVEHLVQLKKSIVRLNDLFTNKSNVGCDGDENEYPFGRSKNLTVKCMWKQKHMFDGLYTMSRESSSLLKDAEDKSDSCSTVNDELHKILGIIKDKEFMNARRLLGKFCGRNWDSKEFPVVECSQVFLAPKSMKQLLRSNFKILDQLRGVFQGQIVGKSSVTEKLIGCFHDVLSKGNSIEKEYYDALEHRMQLVKDTGRLIDIEVVSEIEFAKSVRKTSKQIDEAVQELVSLRGSILSEDSPHGNITLWRVLYESLLVNFQLDLICDNLGGTVKLGVSLLKNARLKDSADLHQLHASIVKLTASYNGVLLDFLAMQKTLSEVTCIVAEVFVPRCTGMLAEETGCSSSDVIMTSDEDLDFLLQEHVGICDDVPGEDDEYDWEDPDVWYVMSGRGADNFDFDFDDGVEFD